MPLQKCNVECEESEGLCLRICESQAKPEELQPHNSRPAVSRISSSIGLPWAACISCPTHFFTAAAVARPAVPPPAAPCAFTSRRLPAGALYSCFSRGRLLISRCSCYGWLKKNNGNYAFTLILNKIFQLKLYHSLYTVILNVMPAKLRHRACLPQSYISFSLSNSK